MLKYKTMMSDVTACDYVISLIVGHAAAPVQPFAFAP